MLRARPPSLSAIFGVKRTWDFRGLLGFHLGGHKEQILKKLAFYKLFQLATPYLLGYYSMDYRTRKVIAALTNVRLRILSWARSSQFSSRTFTSQKSLLILSSQHRLGLLNGLFPSGLPSKMEYNLCFSPTQATS